ncbi:MAG: phosphate ABC transporter substrate-binding protein [Rudaea sp.]
MRAVLRAGLLLPLLLGVVYGCSPTPTPTPAPVTIRIGGADSMQFLARDLATAFHDAHPNVTIDVQPTNSNTGLLELARGSLDLALVSRNPRADELQPRRAKAVEIARDAIVILVHPSNLLSDLSREQATGIFAGEIINWSELRIEPPNGADAIEVISRESGSGTRAVFEQLLMRGHRTTPAALVRPGTPRVLDYIQSHPAAVGYASYSAWKNAGALRALSIGGVSPTLDTIQNNSYPLAQPLYLAVPSNAGPEVDAFVDFCDSAEARMLISGRMAPPLH